MDADSLASTEITLTAAECRALTALQHLAARWPKTLWLFATPGSLNVMRLGPDGERVMKPLSEYFVKVARGDPRLPGF